MTPSHFSQGIHHLVRVLPVSLGQLTVVLDQGDFVAVEAAGGLGRSLSSDDIQHINAKQCSVCEYQRANVSCPAFVASKRAFCNANLSRENILI
ncbi:hypothetical protein [Ectopseudomonas khazarica]|uniref:hypothetical protein n=1 Tax=Ectopseudomonas khazarica TaxID=2502979 RepID=UPI0037C5D64B